MNTQLPITLLKWRTDAGFRRFFNGYSQSTTGYILRNVEIENRLHLQTNELKRKDGGDDNADKRDAGGSGKVIFREMHVAESSEEHNFYITILAACRLSMAAAASFEL